MQDAAAGKAPAPLISISYRRSDATGYAFQAAQGLVVDDKCGPATQAALKKATPGNPKG